MTKIKICLACGAALRARKDARTCSVRCRKRLQRQKDSLALELFNSPTATDAPVFNRWRRLRSLALAMLILAVGGSARHVLAVAQGYLSYDSGLKQGMAVELAVNSSEGQKIVDRAKDSQPARFLGISVGLNDSTVTIASASEEVFVVNNGEAQAYVSDVNGAVKKGDLLALSPLNGILMKNNDLSQAVVGVALSDFPNSWQEVSATTKTGKQTETKVAKMPIDVNVASAGGANAGGWLQRVGYSLTGRNIGATRVTAALIIFTALLVIEGAITYSTVSSSLKAIGRNPLAGKLIRTQAVKSFGMAVVFLLIGGSIISMILWL